MQASNATQTVDYFDTFGNDVRGDITVYSGDVLENLTEYVDLTDGQRILRNVRLTRLGVVESTDDRTVFNFQGTTAAR